MEEINRTCGASGGGGGVNLYKCATFYLFLSLHYAPEELI